MASWSGFLAASGFRYRGQERRIEALPRLKVEGFRSFWAAGTGWGTFELSSSKFSITPQEGFLFIREVELPAREPERRLAVELMGKPIGHKLKRENGRLTIVLENELKLEASGKLAVSM
jgi:hypothetical protein